MKKVLVSVFLTLGMMQAQAAGNFPSQPVKIISSLPAGSGPDVVVRKMAAELEKKWGQNVVVENRPGASGLIAKQHYVSLPADGHAIYFGDAGSYMALSVLYKKQDVLDQLRPLASLSLTDWMIVAPAKIKTFAELKNNLKSNPKFGSWAVGSMGHVCGLEISQAVGVNSLHVAYKDYGAWFADTSNNVLSLACSSVGSTRASVEAGRLNYVATAGAKRDPKYPDVPTLREVLGQDIKSSNSWLGFLANKNIPAEVAAKLEKDIRDALNSKEVTTAIENGLRARRWDVTVPEFEKRIKQDIRDYQEITARYNIKVEQ